MKTRSEKTYKYEIRVNGRVWVRGNNEEAALRAAESARRGWAKGQKVEVVELK